MTKTRGRPFKPGQSGNPAGRPRKPDCLTDALRELAGQPGPGGLTHAQRLAAVLWRKAEAGDVRAAALIGDRLEGRPGQRVEVATPDGGGSIDLCKLVLQANSVSELAARVPDCDISEWAAKMHTGTIPQAEAAREPHAGAPDVID